MGPNGTNACDIALGRLRQKMTKKSRRQNGTIGNRIGQNWTNWNNVVQNGTTLDNMGQNWTKCCNH